MLFLRPSPTQADGSILSPYDLTPTGVLNMPSGPVVNLENGHFPGTPRQ